MLTIAAYDRNRVVGGVAIHIHVAAKHPTKARLIDRTKPKMRSAVRFVFAGDFSPAVITGEGVLLAPVADLVRMKLIGFRLKDQVHIQDLDSVRLITPQVEAGLTPELLDRLRQVRASR